MEKIQYEGQIIRITEEVIDNLTWERAYLPDGVIIFPITKDKKIILIEERRPHEKPHLRIKPISGILEKDQSPEENAQREMQEEVGLKAQKLDLFWELKTSGTVNSTQYFFMARDLLSSKIPNPDGEDVILRTVEYSLEELERALFRDDIKWSHSTLGIFRLLNFLKKHK